MESSLLWYVRLRRSLPILYGGSSLQKFLPFFFFASALMPLWVRISRRQTTRTNVIAPEFGLTADRITAAILSPFLQRIPGRGCPYSAQAGNASPAKGITRTATCHGWHHTACRVGSAD